MKKVVGLIFILGLMFGAVEENAARHSFVSSVPKTDSQLARDYGGTNQLDYGMRTSKYIPGSSISSNAIGIPEPSDPGNSKYCNPGDQQIAIFSETNYKGDCVVKNIGLYQTPDKIGFPHGNVSSIKVGKDVRFFICFVGKGNIRERCISSSKSLPSALPAKFRGRKLQLVRVAHLDRPFGSTPYSIGRAIRTANDKSEYKCLEVVEDKSKESVEIQFVKCGQSQKQRWLYNSLRQIQGYDYRCLASVNGGAQVEYTACNISNSQKWIRGRGFRFFKNAASGKCLSSDGESLSVQTCARTNDQGWIYMSRRKAEEVTASDVRVIEFSGEFEGSFRSYKSGVWAEYESGNKKPLAYYNETRRDKWSVYLKKNDGTIIQFDLRNNQILINNVFSSTITYTSK